MRKLVHLWYGVEKSARNYITPADRAASATN